MKGPGLLRQMRLRGVLALVLVMGILHPGQSGFAMPEAAAEHVSVSAPMPPPGVHILAQDRLGIELEFVAPAYTVIQEWDDQGDCQRLVIEGYGELGASGAPALPVRGIFVGAPPEADLRLEVLDIEQDVLPGRYAVCPAATPISDFRLEGPPASSGVERVRDSVAYAAPGFAPQAAVELLSSGYVRHQRVAELRFAPLRYDPVQGQVQHVRRIRVRLYFEGDRYRAQLAATATSELASAAREDAFDGVLKNLLVNYEAAQAWRVAPQISAPSAPVTQSVPNPQFRIVTREAGMYKVTYEDLLAAAPDWDWDNVDPRNFHLRNQGQEVAIRVAGEYDGSWDPGDWLLFYGEQIDSKYTLDNIYWLTWDQFPGMRMSEILGVPGNGATPSYFETTRHMEVDYWYQTSLPSGDDNDRWYWDYIQWPTFKTRQYQTDLQNVVTAPVSATLRGLFRGYSANPNHQVQVFLNSHQVYSATWTSGQAHSFSISVPSNIVVDGANTISINRWGNPVPTADTYFTNWFQLDYFKAYLAEDNQLFFDGDDLGTWKYRVAGFTTDVLEAYDITDPLMPVQIGGAEVVFENDHYALIFEQTIAAEHHYLALSPDRYRSPKRVENDRLSNWRSPQNGADYIIISHRDFITAVQPLSQSHSAAGLRVVTVDAQDLYDEFGAGWISPEAIRDFVAYAYTHWVPPSPAYVLLVGDGHYDFKNNHGFEEKIYVPPYLADVDPWMGETAADNRYVTVIGDDVWPDLHLGRLPVKTAAETVAMVNKILAYGANSSAADWQRKILFVADNPDSGGHFYNLSNAVADHYVPAPYSVQKIYYGVSPYTTGAGTRAAIVSAINEGRLMVNYVGHASIQFWASEQLMNLTAIGQLTNEGKLPFMIPMACFEGLYHYPSSSSFNYSSFAETIVRKANGGAIASFSPTGQGLATGHQYMHTALYQAIFFNDIAQLGPATMLSKYALAGMGHDYLIDTYLLFGDPATRLNTQPADVSVSKTVTPTTPLQPGDWLTYTLTYTNAGPARANNVVLRDLLPTALVSPTFTSAGATITPRMGTLFIWDVAALPPNTGGVVTVTARVRPDFSGVFTNTATISTSARETDTDNNTSAPLVSTVIAADVTIQKHGPHSVWPGDTITYTLVYTNIGDVLASGVVITDLLPAPLLSPAVTSSGASITPRPNTAFVWDVANLAPGASGVITITGLVSPTFEGDLTNRATISTLSPEPNQANNTSTLYTGVLMADLALSKTGPVTTTPGALVTYRLTYSNIGSGVAAGVVLTETLPDGLVEPITVTFTGAAITPRPNTAFVWDVEDLGIGAGGVITITARVASDFSGVLLNQAEISTTSPEVHLLNNVVTPVSTAVLLADMSLSKRGPAVVNAGDRITYTLVYGNMGDVRATGVVITDTLPAALFDVSVTSVGAAITPRAGIAFVWDVASLPPGAGGVITITGQITPTFEGLLTNTAMISTETPEFVVDNNSDAVTTAVLMADLALTKSGPAAASPGERIAYVLRYRNEGTSVATGVILTDTLPVQLLDPVVLSSGAPITLREGSAFVWDVADLAPDAGGVITITATVPATFRGELSNQALITTRSPENHIQNNVSAPVVTLVSAADVSIAKNGPAEALAGSQITYTLTYANSGDALAAGVVITDLLPTQLQGASYTASNPGVALRPGTRFVWDVGALAPGASGVITITAQIPATFAGTLTNTATIATSSVEVNIANNVSAPVVTQVQLRERKVYLPLVMRAP